MKTSPLSQDIKARNPNSPLPFDLALGGALVALGIWAASLLPPVQNAVRQNGPMPAGQFQADARSVVAALRYVFEPEADVDTDAFASTGSNDVDIVHAPERPCEMLAYSSNQIEWNAIASTNRPGRS